MKPTRIRSSFKEIAVLNLARMLPVPRLQRSECVRESFLSQVPKVRSNEAVSKLEMRALQGRHRTAQGASPGNRRQTKTEPCRGGAEACTALTGLSYSA